MLPNRFRHRTEAAFPTRIAAGAADGAFVPVAVSAAQHPWVAELYRQAAELTRAQLAPPKHLRSDVFSAN